MKTTKPKNHIKTNAYRSIKKSFPRFLSLMVMATLGVLVFVGLQSTSPDMVKTLDKNYDEYNTYDIKVMSSMGLIDDDLESLKKIDNVKEVEGTHFKDVLIKTKEKEYVLNITSLPKNINKLKLIEGKLPTKDNEIVVEESFIKRTGYKIGDTIKFEDEFNNNELVITGTIESSLYFNNTAIFQSRGATSIGTGTIDFYSYMPSNNFKEDFYTAIYLTVDDAIDKVTSTKEYEKTIKEVTDKIEKIKHDGEENRYNKIYDEALAEINKNEDKANKELAKAKDKLDDAKKKLNSSKNKLDKAKKDLNYFKSELNKAKTKLDNGKKEFNATLKKYNIKINEIDKNINVLNNNIKKLEDTLKNIPKEHPLYAQYKKQLDTLIATRNQLITIKKTNETLINGEKEYNKNLKTYNNSKASYDKGINAYNKGLKEYNKGLKEYEDSKEEVKEEISDAKLKLNDIKLPTWFINDRNDDGTYSSYIDQTKSVKRLSAVFPLVFFAVAILVSLISMNRMVEDDRGEIGTLKSLGFSNKEIQHKYLLFSLTATLIGGLIGTIGGITILPYLMFSVYRLLFILPNFQMGLNLGATIVGLLISIICICGTTIYTTSKVLQDKPAALMRPKPPTKGKKILLEKWTWFWNKLKFSNKVTIRNIFRYKKRVLVTIFGIAGCTALMLCGFGVKDSIVDITTMQYENTFKSDATVYTNELDLKNVSKLFNNPLIEETIITQNITAKYKDSNVNILVTETNEDMSKIINLYNKDDEIVKLEEGKVIITDKLADIYKLKIGDTIKLRDTENHTYEFTISNIVKNYLGHYIYLDKATLFKTLKKYEPNIVYLNTKELSTTDQENLSKELLKNDELINIVYKNDIKNRTKDMLDALNSVVAILILLAAALSFVVLYNLSNINISERKREIATLKVLGFYDKEVDNYITKENVILTIVGIILGLVFGYFLTNITIGTVEMENARFLRKISLNSYIYSALIACVFTAIVDFVTHFILKKIDMIESLKSVE